MPRPLLLLISAAVLSSCRQADVELPANLVVVTIDTLRADHVGCYGYFRDTTPNVDLVAAEGVVFERCMTPVAQTLPTHTSLFTGLYPYEHGILANLTDKHVYTPSPQVETLAMAMRAEGYDTAGFVAAAPLKTGSGVEQGFDHWWEPKKVTADGDEVVDRAIDWLADGRKRPVMMWVHVFDPHRPYRPREGYRELFESGEDQATYLAEVGVAEVGELDTKIPSDTGRADYDHDMYDGEVRFSDAQLGRLFDHMKSIGMWENTVLVITSDHGEGLWQHGRIGHGHIWLETLHVPCILKAPGVGPARIAEPLGTNDILATAVARLPELGLERWRAQTTGQDMLGTLERGPVFGQFPASRNPIAHSVVDGEWRLITDDGDDRLYHLASDPHELRNVAAENPAVVERLRASIDAALERQQALGRSLEVGGMREADQAQRDGLGELGYGGDGDDE